VQPNATPGDNLPRRRDDPPLGGPGDFNVWDAGTGAVESCRRTEQVPNGKTIAREFDCDSGWRKVTVPTPRGLARPRPRGRTSRGASPVPRRGSRRTTGTRGPPSDDPDDEPPSGLAPRAGRAKQAGSFTAHALAYFTERAIEPEVAASVGVREQRGALTFTYAAPDGSTFERRRNLSGRVKVMQPAGVGLCLWWPEGRPA